MRPFPLSGRARSCGVECWASSLSLATNLTCSVLPRDKSHLGEPESYPSSPSSGPVTNTWAAAPG